MSGPGHTIFEDLAWIAVALVAVIVLFACLAIALAVSSSTNPLTARSKLITNAKPRQARESAPVRPIGSDFLRYLEFLCTIDISGKPIFGKLRPLESASAPK